MDLNLTSQQKIVIKEALLFKASALMKNAIRFTNLPGTTRDAWRLEAESLIELANEILP